MPDFPIVDAHMHLWDPQRLSIPWLAENTLLNQAYTPQEYQAHTQGIAVEAMVYVEVDVAPSYMLVEPHQVLAWVQEDPRIQAIVANAPVENGERIRSYLDTLTGISPLIKGVRRLVQSEPDPTFCTRPDFVRGVQILADYGLTFELGLRHPQLASAIQLVRKCPDTTFMLDHIGKPDIQYAQHHPWREYIQELASCPNVTCKVSGMVTEADHKHWTPANLEPYITHVLAAFGEDRVAFGGDWPVILQASSYKRWVETLDQLTAHLSDNARRKLWAENAKRFYRLTTSS